MSFDRIPLAMREFSQFVTWRYEYRAGEAKPAKLPYSPLTGSLAAVDAPHTWGSFNDAVSAYQRGGFDGIGFVLTKDDPFCFIDFDAPKSEEQMDRHNRLFDAIDTYTELSPSGTGYHKIIIGSIPQGRKRHQLEIYDDRRYMTMTGHVVGDCVDIRDYHEFANWLYHELSRPDAAPRNSFDAPATDDDKAVADRTFAAAYGLKARDLYEGRWQAHYPSASEADLALVNFLSFNTNNREQAQRLFAASALYPGTDRKYEKRSHLLADMIDMAFAIKSDPDAHSGIIAKVRAFVEADAEKRRKSRILVPTDELPIVDVGELAGRPIVPPRWLVEGLIPDRTVTLYSGDGGVGKSQGALQLAFAVATNGRWFGSAVRQGGCLFLTAEDEIDEIHRRLFAISRSEDVVLDRLPHRLSIAPLAGHDALLAIPAARGGVLAPTPLFGALRAQIDAQRPALVVLDTSADLFGGEENNRTHVRQFVAMLRATAMDFDTAMLLLSHPSLTGISSGSGTSGSTAWNNSVRSRLYMTRDEADPNVRVLRVMKANYGAVGEEIRLEYRSGVFAAIGRAANGAAHRAAAEQSVDDLFVSLLAEFTDRGQYVSRSPQSINYAPKLFAANPRSQGFTKQQFAGAMTRLSSSGRIADTKAGPFASKQRDAIVIAGISNSLPTPISG